jgi:hypothetical protein
MKQLLIVLAAFLCLTITVVRADSSDSNLLSSSNGPVTWRFSQGPEYPGATGKIEMNGPDGEQEIDMHYDFSNGGEYVAAIADVKLPSLSELRFSAKVDTASKNVLIRLVDSTGQVFQLSENGSGGYRDYRLNLSETKWDLTYGKSKSQTITFPIVAIWLGINKVANSTPSGDAVFKDIEALK